VVVDHHLGGREAVLAGPLVPIAEAEGLGEQRPLGGQPLSEPVALTGGCSLGMLAIPTSADQPGQQMRSQDEEAGPGDDQQPEPDQQPGQARQRRKAGHQRAQRGRRRRAISRPSQQRSTSSPSPSSACSVHRQRVCQPDAQAGQSGLSAHISQPPPQPQGRAW
jgi:hypothetical protein